jgi:hypothetical protein
VRDTSGRKTKKKFHMRAIANFRRRELFFGGVVRVGLMTETGGWRHGKGSRQSHCPVSDMIDLHQCSLAVDAANLFQSGYPGDDAEIRERTTK